MVKVKITIRQIDGVVIVVHCGERRKGSTASVSLMTQYDDEDASVHAIVNSVGLGTIWPRPRGLYVLYKVCRVWERYCTAIPQSAKAVGQHSNGESIMFSLIYEQHNIEIAETQKLFD